MRIINSPENFIGEPHPWVVLSHFAEADRSAFFKKFTSYQSYMRGTLINASGHSLSDDPATNDAYRLAVEWRQIAMDTADYIVMQLGLCYDIMFELGLYGRTGKLYVFRHHEEEHAFFSEYLDHMLDLMRVPQITDPIQIIQSLEDAERGAS